MRAFCLLAKQLLLCVLLDFNSRASHGGVRGVKKCPQIYPGLDAVMSICFSVGCMSYSHVVANSI